GTQDPVSTLEMGKGSCRDFALLMMEAVRSLGLAARFVSGYLYVPASDGRRVGGGATHAWLEIYLPGAGWMEFDPTNGSIGNRDLIRVAVVRDPRQAVPLTGTWTGDPSDLIGMDVEVSVNSNGRSRGTRLIASQCGQTMWLDPSIVILLFSAGPFFPSIWAAEARNVILVPRRPVSAKHLLGPPVSVLPTPAAPVTWVAGGWRKAR